LLGPQRSSVIAQLLSAAGGENAYVQSATIGALARLGCNESFELAERAVESSNPYVREAGIRLFGLAAPEGELGRLEEFINDPHRPASLAAVRAIGQRGWKPALPRLLDLLASRREEIRQQFGKRPPRRGEIAPLLRTIVAFMGGDAVPLLLEIAEHDVSIRSYAARELVYLDSPEAAPVLAHLLAEPTRSLREQILSIVHRANYRASLPLVRPLLESPESTIRERALAIVHDWNDTESTSILTRMAHQEANPVLRVRVIETLVVIAGVATENTLLDLADDTNAQVREAVVESLARFPNLSEPALFTLQHIVQNDVDDSVRFAAEGALAAHHQTFARTLESPVSSVADLVVPTSLLPNLASLKEALELWRRHLPVLARTRSVEEICKLDEALSSLLGALEATRLLLG
jgi:HEAT repeat protein